MAFDPSPLKYVGQSLPLDDARLKAAGQVRYVADMEIQGLLHTALVVSDHPHARILAVHDAEALQAGAIKVFSCFNTPRTEFNTQKWFIGQKGREDQRIFPDTARYVGEPVAVVAAEDRATAEAAAARVRVEYEPLDFVIDPEEALAGRVAIHPHPPATPIELKAGPVETIDDIFRNAAAVVEDRVETPKVHPGAMENHACLAIPQPDGGIIVHSPCQILFAVRGVVAQALSLPLSKVRVVKAPVGGSFGGKQETTFEPLAACLALDLKRPVLVELTRRQSVLAARTRTKTIGYARTAVDAEGRILGRDVRLVVDAGAYTSNGLAISMAMGKKLFRLYRMPVQRYRANVVHTNTPVSGAVRGYGSPQIHAVTEINLDRAAEAVGLDPVAFRLKNLVHPYDLDPSGGPALGNARIIECVESGTNEFGWEARWSRPRPSGRWRTGVGMACGSHGNGYFGAYQDFSTMTIRLVEDGGLILSACLHELGHGVNTVMKQLVAEVMSLDPERIVIPEPDTSLSPYDIGCQASRGTYVIGGCAVKAAEELKSLFIDSAARVLDRRPDEIVLEDGWVRVSGDPSARISYGEMVCRIQIKLQTEMIRTVTYSAPANPAAFGAHFAEVKVDAHTGRVAVTDYLAVHDLGRALNPGFVRGQIHGAVQMGLGMALYEDLEIDPKTGKPKSDRFSRYHMVNAPDMPEPKIMLVERGEDLGPFGAKSIGEIATVPVAPAILNAVHHALGIRLNHYPATPERILAALAEVEDES